MVSAYLLPSPRARISPTDTHWYTLLLTQGQEVKTNGKHLPLLKNLRWLPFVAELNPDQHPGVKAWLALAVLYSPLHDAPALFWVLMTWLYLPLHSVTAIQTPAQPSGPTPNARSQKELPDCSMFLT